jgi:hypothetical protein
LSHIQANTRFAPTSNDGFRAIGGANLVFAHSPPGTRKLEKITRNDHIGLDKKKEQQFILTTKIHINEKYRKIEKVRKKSGKNFS